MGYCHLILAIFYEPSFSCKYIFFIASSCCMVGYGPHPYLDSRWFPISSRVHFHNVPISTLVAWVCGTVWRGLVCVQPRGHTREWECHQGYTCKGSHGSWSFSMALSQSVSLCPFGVPFPRSGSRRFWESTNVPKKVDVNVWMWIKSSVSQERLCCTTQVWGPSNREPLLTLLPPAGLSAPPPTQGNKQMNPHCDFGDPTLLQS